jgi:hypothetical protein
VLGVLRRELLCARDCIGHVLSVLEELEGFVLEGVPEDKTGTRKLHI